MKLLGFVTGLLLLASTAQAQLGTWPFKSGGGGGASSLSLEQSMAQYSLIDDDDLITLTTATDVPLVNVSDGGTWALSSKTVGWTGTTSGSERGKLVRDSGVATAVHIVFGQVCMHTGDAANDNLNIAGYISINGTTAASSQGWVISTPNDKKVCATMSLLTDVAASDAISIEMKRVGLAGSKTYTLASITITAFAPHYVPPTVNIEVGDTTLAATEVSGGIITNVGASGAAVYTLPVAVAGMSVTIINEAAQTIKMEPNGTDRITNLTNADGDSVTSDGVVTSALTLISTVNNKWWGIPVGTWNDTN